MGRRPVLQEEVGILWAGVSMETGREVPVHNPGLLADLRVVANLVCTSDM